MCELIKYDAKEDTFSRCKHNFKQCLPENI